MKISNLFLNIGLLILLIVCLSADHIIVSSTETAVKSSCQTHVAYDKTGSIYCVQNFSKPVKLAGR